jgi:hypothetical protein
LDVFNANVFRLGPDHLSPKVSKIGTKDTVGIFNVLYSEGAIGDKSFMYHPLELLVHWVSYQPLDPSCFLGLGNVVLCMTFKIISDGIDLHALKVAPFFRCFVVMKPFLAWIEFHNSCSGVDLENTITILAVVCDPVLGLGWLQ